MAGEGTKERRALEATENERGEEEEEAVMDALHTTCAGVGDSPARCARSCCPGGATWTSVRYRRVRALYSASLLVTEAVTPILRAALLCCGPVRCFSKLRSRQVLDIENSRQRKGEDLWAC